MHIQNVLDCWSMTSAFSFSCLTDPRSETVRSEPHCPRSQKKQGSGAERWQHNNAANQPLQTASTDPQVTHTHTHKNWYRSCWSLSAAIRLTGCVWYSILCRTRLLIPSSVACMRTRMFGLARLHFKVAFLHATSYLLSSPREGFVFLVTSGARSFLQTLVWAVHGQPRHLVQDVLCRRGQKDRAHEGESGHRYAVCSQISETYNSQLQTHSTLLSPPSPMKYNPCVYFTLRW